MWSVQALPLPIGLWACCSLILLPLISAGTGAHSSDILQDAADEASARRPLMRYEKPDAADSPLESLGGQSVGTSSEIKANDASTRPVLKKTFGNRKKAMEAAKDATEPVDGIPDNPDLNNSKFWNQRLEVIRKAESKSAGEDLRAGEMDIIKVLDAVLPKRQRSKVMVSVGRDDNKTHGQLAQNVTLPLLEKLAYRGLILQMSKAPVEKRALDDQLSKANGSGRVFTMYRQHVSPEGVGEYFQQADVPSALDVLKIATESYDLALLKGILKQNFDPKIIIMEMNHDLAPPINWFLSYHPNFVFTEKIASSGTYGASPDAVYEELSINQKYSLIGIDMQNGRHDMWFVKNSLVRVPSQADQPLVSWRGMVRMFWQQQVGHTCTGIPHKIFSCPLNFLREIYKEAQGVLPSNFSRDSWEQMADISIYLANPNFQKKDAPYGYVTLLNQALIGQCGKKRDFCHTTFKVTKDPSQNDDMHDEEEDGEDDASLTAMKASRHVH
mmetsp:Transcript_105741/g.203249  ORF Transcript_105741/g.203249 Transcript_105741/m.203249 type:complete len:499 (+) Transcript_105741:55-1551(+)